MENEKISEADTAIDSSAGLLELVTLSLEDDKAGDIVSIDIRNKTILADYLVMATGRSQRHVGAVAEHLIERLKENKWRPVGVEGMPRCDWVLIDAGDVIAHIFRQEVREFYNLEKMWSVELPASEQAVS
ncbi:MAG: ribosome silencing factor [Alphaproteobacteria bacterium]|nr:ribosome silencing factor [Alphaproteobacteria bacterium]